MNKWYNVLYTVGNAVSDELVGLLLAIGFLRDITRLAICPCKSTADFPLSACAAACSLGDFVAVFVSLCVRGRCLLPTHESPVTLKCCLNGLLVADRGPARPSSDTSSRPACGLLPTHLPCTLALPAL